MTFRCFHSLNRFWRVSTQVKLFHHHSRLTASPLLGSTIDFEYLSDPRNEAEIENNIKARKGVGCLRTFRNLLLEYESALSSEKSKLWDKLVQEGLKIPNRSDPRLIDYGELPSVVETPVKPAWNFPPREFHDLAKRLDLLRMENLGNLTGQRSYYFMKDLAQLEQGLIHYTVDVLTKKGFTFYSVPDLLNSKLIESCGMDTHSERTQVYRLEPKFYGDVCLSGTAEMALASYHAGRTISKEQLPMKMAAVSRCYRAETSNIQVERGIYRVHQFTKVEMFGLTEGNVAASDRLLDEFVSIQKELFTSLGIRYQLLDMPMNELGAPAYRKFDVEAWMPGRNMFGEISSASNCTDYQSRRLGIRCGIDQGFVHTVNGTACALPRTIITLLETHQQANGDVVIPAVLQPFCDGLQKLTKSSAPFKLRWTKSKSQQTNVQSS